MGERQRWTWRDISLYAAQLDDDDVNLGWLTSPFTRMCQSAPTDTVARVAKLMKTENISSVPICEGRHGKKLLGIVTDWDLALT